MNQLGFGFFIAVCMVFFNRLLTFAEQYFNHEKAWLGKFTGSIFVIGISIVMVAITYFVVK